MSVWTHVVGAIRIDGLPRLFPAIFNKEVIEDVVKGNTCYEGRKLAVYDNPIPSGSEGPLQYRIHEYETGLPWVIVTIWGDLRDFDDAESVKCWFEGLCLACGMVRDGILQIEVGGQKPVVVQYVQY